MISLMLPYTVGLFILWVVLSMFYWAPGVPLGIQASYTYPYLYG